MDNFSIGGYGSFFSFKSLSEIIWIINQLKHGWYMCKHLAITYIFGHIWYFSFSRQSLVDISAQVPTDIEQRRTEEVYPNGQLDFNEPPGASDLIKDQHLWKPTSCQSAVVRFRNAEVIVSPSYFNLECDKERVWQTQFWCGSHIFSVQTFDFNKCLQ